MLDWFLNNWDALVSVLTALVTAAAAITALTPGQADDAVVAKIRQVLNLLALNVGHAKNRDG